jgi:hypothetical protein
LAIPVPPRGRTSRRPPSDPGPCQALRRRLSNSASRLAGVSLDGEDGCLGEDALRCGAGIGAGPLWKRSQVPARMWQRKGLTDRNSSLARAHGDAPVSAQRVAPFWSLQGIHNPTAQPVGVGSRLRESRSRVESRPQAGFETGATGLEAATSSVTVPRRALPRVLASLRWSLVARLSRSWPGRRSPPVAAAAFHERSRTAARRAAVCGRVSYGSDGLDPRPPV